MTDKLPSYRNYEVKNIAGLYNIGNTIGKGHFAVVKEAKHVFTGEKVAIKIIDKTKLDEQAREHLFSEVMCMKLVQHPNVVRLYEVIDTVNKLYLVLELGDGGDLYDYIMNYDDGLLEVDARKYFRQIVHAISYCHKLHVVHRDLKPENVVFFEKLHLVKLTDFGFSNKFVPGQTLETSCGSLAYSAPEILLGDAYDAPKIDIWSLGVLLFMLVCGRLPFDETNDSETLSKIMDCKYEFPSKLSNNCKNLIRKMLVRDPDRRANLDEILQDKWLESTEKDIENVCLPLISQDCLTVEEHLEILNKMSEGNLAPIEEIQSILDRNEYSYISATYFLLAERKLKRRYIEEFLTMKFIELDPNEPSSTNSITNASNNIDDNYESESSDPVNTSATTNQESNEERFRRFSMILEDEENEEEEEELEAMISLATVREELDFNSPMVPSRTHSKNSNTSNISINNNSCNNKKVESYDSNNTNGNPNTTSKLFYNFRRFKCKSAIYNKASLLYPSRSLSSIPMNCDANFMHAQTNNSMPQQHNSSYMRQISKTNQFGVPRFFRTNRNSFALSLIEPVNSFTDDTTINNVNTKHRPSLPQSVNNQMFSNSHSNFLLKRRSFPALLQFSGNRSLSQSSSDVSEQRISITKLNNTNRNSILPQSIIAPKYNSNSSIASDAIYRQNPATSLASNIKRRIKLRSANSRPSSMGAAMTLQIEELQHFLSTNTPHKIHKHDERVTNSLTNSTEFPISPPNSSNETNPNVHRDIITPIHEEDELIRSRSYIDKESNIKLLDYSPRNSSKQQLQFRSMSVEHHNYNSTDNTPQKYNRTSKLKHDSNSISGNSNIMTTSNFSLSNLAFNLKDSKAMLNVIRGAYELQHCQNQYPNIRNNLFRNQSSLAHSNRVNYSRSYHRPISLSACGSGRESQNFTHNINMICNNINNNPNNISNNNNNTIKNNNGSLSSLPASLVILTKQPIPASPIIGRKLTNDCKELSSDHDKFTKEYESLNNNSIVNNLQYTKPKDIKNNNNSSPRNRNIFSRVRGSIYRKFSLFFSCCSPSHRRNNTNSN